VSAEAAWAPASEGPSRVGTSSHSHSLIGRNDADLTPEERAARGAVKRFFQERLGVEPFDADYAYMQFLVPRDREELLAPFVRELQAEARRLLISDIHISLTTLEEVFLKVKGAAARLVLEKG